MTSAVEPPRRSLAGRAPSLSNSAHTRSQDGPQGPSSGGRSTVTVWRGGELVEARVCPEGESGQPLRGGGERGKVSTVQSFASRRRMGQFLGKLQGDALPAFVTLTIPPGVCPAPLPDPEDGEPDRATLPEVLAALRHRFARAFPSGAVVWKREHHRSGIPHFHMLVWLNTGQHLAREVYQLQRWLPGAWSEILTARARVNVQAARNAKAVKHYTSAYLWRGKGYQLDAHGINWGRWWGTWNQDALPYAERVTVQGPPAMYHAAVRVAGRLGYRGKVQRNGQPTARFLAKHGTETWVRHALLSGGEAQEGHHQLTTGSPVERSAPAP